MTEYFSIHTDIFWIEGRACSGGWPGVGVGGSSREISDISTYSRSRIFFATLVGREAAGLYGPLPVSPAAGVVSLACVK